MEPVFRRRENRQASGVAQDMPHMVRPGPLTGGLKLGQGTLHLPIKRLLREPEPSLADHAPGQAGSQAFRGQGGLGQVFPVPGLALAAPQLLLQVVPQDGAGAVRRPPGQGNGAGAGLQQPGPGVEDQHQGVVDYRPQGIPFRRRGDPGPLQVGLDASSGQGLQPDGPELPGEAGQEAPHIEPGGGDHLDPGPPGPILDTPGHGVLHGRGDLVEAVQKEHQPWPRFPAPLGQLLQLPKLARVPCQGLPPDVCANEVIPGAVPQGVEGDVDGGNMAGQEMLLGGEGEKGHSFSDASLSLQHQVVLGWAAPALLEKRRQRPGRFHCAALSLAFLQLEPGQGEQVLVYLHQLEAGVLTAGSGQALCQVIVQLAVHIAAHGVGPPRTGIKATAAALRLPVPVGDLDGAVLIPAVMHHAKFRILVVCGGGQLAGNQVGPGIHAGFPVNQVGTPSIIGPVLVSGQVDPDVCLVKQLHQPVLHCGVQVVEAVVAQNQGGKAVCQLSPEERATGGLKVHCVHVVPLPIGQEGGVQM